MKTAQFLAFDLGADSGRAVVGHLEDRTLRLEEIHRFPNSPVRILDRLYWDAPRLFEEIRKGIQICAAKYPSVEGIGVNTWGVDCALLDAEGELVSNPYCYRDDRTSGIPEKISEIIPREKLFEITGIQFMQLNTLNQIYATKLQKPGTLDRAATLLMMPDLMHYWLTGRKAAEITIASTSQCFDARKRTWSKEIFEALGLPHRILPEIIQPGTILGPLPAHVNETLAGVSVIAPAGHDTASAYGAVPVRSPDAVLISSGTWSTLGIELSQPAISPVSLKNNFTNECGLDGKYMFRKNITGMWLLQECRRKWTEEEGEAPSYDECVKLAAAAKPFGPFIEVDHGSFLQPGGMPLRIREFCRSTGQKVPEDKGSMIRCIFESLALKYKWVLDAMEEALQRRTGDIHIVGGGSKNRMLCQFTSDLTRRRVVAGPDEATASGNVMMQAIAKGRIANVAEGRSLIAGSFEMAEYEPRDGKRWEEHYRGFLAMKERSTTLL